MASATLSPSFRTPTQGENTPLSLRPTSFQQSTLHPDWIDILPSPRMRDNATGTLHLYTHGEPVADLPGGLVGRQKEIDSRLLVWTNPWEPSSWELTEGFIRKWGFLVQGCTELVQSANRWRGAMRRGTLDLGVEMKRFNTLWRMSRIL